MSIVGIKRNDVRINLDDVIKVIHFERKHPECYQDDPHFCVAQDELDLFGMMNCFTVTHSILFHTLTSE